jgi:predicted nuclease of restriction endonuclease-like (RecB) superfamily
MLNQKDADGYTIDFIFCHRKRKFSTTSELKLEDFTKEDAHPKSITP